MSFFCCCGSTVQYHTKLNDIHFLSAENSPTRSNFEHIATPKVCAYATLVYKCMYSANEISGYTN